MGSFSYGLDLHIHINLDYRIAEETRLRDRNSYYSTAVQLQLS